MKIRTYAVVCSLFFVSLLQARQEPSSFGMTLSGFVKTDVMYDSRQTIAFREGHFLLYPAGIVNDRNGVDVNAKDNFNILSIQTRLVGKITGPDALGAKTSAYIEGEFFGTCDIDESGFRMRHAYMRMDWARSSLLIGQFWHPMFVVEMFPGVVSFNTGAPFQPFTRNPQIRFSQAVGNLKVTAAALSQRDFQSNGPSGLSSAYLRNAVLPNLHAQVQYSVGSTLFGCGVDYKMLAPRLVTTKNLVTDATIGSTAFLGYLKFVLDPVTVKTEATYGGNLADMLMLGGYAVRSTDPLSGIETYSALNSTSLWGEVSAGKEVEVALFVGYAKNLGADENVSGAFYGRGTDIDQIFRVSPRIVWNTGTIRFASEFEYTSARYGTPNGLNKGRVENVTNVANARLLLATYYFF